MWKFDFGFLLVTIITGFFSLPAVSGGMTPIGRVVFMFTAALFVVTVIAELVEASTGRRLGHRP